MENYELFAQWLNAMVDKEIKEVTETIDNEGTIILGCETLDEVEMHLDNINVLADYLVLLADIKKGIDTAKEMTELLSYLI